MLKQAIALSAVMFSVSAFAQEAAQPSWEFGCKLEAQAQQKAQQKVVTKVQDVKETDQNTWMFEDRQPQIVASM